MKSIPITILTGYLGSGKTTLMKILGKIIEHHSEIEFRGKKITEIKSDDYNEFVKTIIPKEIHDLNIDYYLCANGSIVCDSKGIVLCTQTINDELIESLTKDFIEYEYPLALRFPSGTLDVNPNISVLKYSRSFFSDEQFERAKKYVLKKHPKDEKVYACLSHIEEESLEELNSKYPELAFVITSGGKLCDITLKNTNKGKGLQNLCNYLEIDIQDCIAFGDDANDIEMIEIAGIGVAMDNALPIVKEHANYITDSCENLGVVKALEYYDLI